MPPRAQSDTINNAAVPPSMRWSDDQCSNSSSEMKSSVDKTTTEAAAEAKAASLPKSVVFAETNEVIDIPHVNDMSDKVIAAVWYHAEEYSIIKKTYQETIAKMEAGEHLSDTEEHTSRGLEYRTHAGAWRRYENKRDSYNAVLDEQDEQWKHDADDPDEIREVYLEHSIKCLKEAQEKGLQDAADIADYLRETSCALPEYSKPKKSKKKKKGSKESKSGKPKKKKAERRASNSSTASVSSDEESEKEQVAPMARELGRSLSLEDKRLTI